MDFPLNPGAKLPYCGRLGLLVFQDGGGVPVLREALLQSSALVGRLLCGRLHNNHYLAESIMWHSAGVLGQEKNQRQPNAT
jgi:hypothetical protein